MRAGDGKLLYAAVYGKTRHMGFSIKIEFDAYLISSIIELTRVQVSDRSLRSRHTPTIKKLRSKGVAMHAYGVSVYYTYTRS